MYKTEMCFIKAALITGWFQYGGADQSCAGQAESCVEDSAVQR